MPGYLLVKLWIQLRKINKILLLPKKKAEVCYCCNSFSKAKGQCWQGQRLIENRQIRKKCWISNFCVIQINDCDKNFVEKNPSFLEKFSFWINVPFLIWLKFSHWISSAIFFASKNCTLGTLSQILLNLIELDQTHETINSHLLIYQLCSIVGGESIATNSKFVHIFWYEWNSLFAYGHFIQMTSIWNCL